MRCRGCRPLCGPRRLDHHQLAKVKVSTADRYRKVVAPFVAWLRSHNLNPVFSDELDDLMMEYKVEESITKANFEALVAATEFVFPSW